MELLTRLDSRALIAVGMLCGSIALGCLLRALIFRRLERLAARTESRLDDAFVGALRGPTPFWFALLGLYAATRVVELPGDWARISSAMITALFVMSLSIWAADLAVRLLSLALRHGRGAVPAPSGVLQNVVCMAVFSVGGLVLLNTLGISVVPILTTVSIGGVAVALGMQDTLANLFAGVHVTLAGNVRVGDFVRLESGEEGDIEDIRWRSTSIRTLPNNLVIVPNARLAQSVVTNYALPANDLAALVEVGVHYSSDLDRVERVTCEVAKRTLTSVQGGVGEFEPFIRFHDFGPHSIDFTVILRARTFVDRYLVKHEFIKSLARR